MKLHLDTPRPPPQFVFDQVDIGKPFWHIRYSAWGIKYDNIVGTGQHNTFMIYKDGGMRSEYTKHDEPVIPGKEVTITIESH